MRVSQTPAGLPTVLFPPSPLGGANDLDALIAQANLGAYKYAVQLVGNATYQSPTPPRQLVPGATIYGAAGSGIVCGYTNGGNPLNPDGSYKAPFNYDGVTHPSGGTTTLASGATLFGFTISITAKNIGPGGANIFARSVSGNVTTPGSFIAIEDTITSGAANQWAMFEVTSISGSGPYTIGLDVPILYAFPNGCNVIGLTPGSDITIVGNGMVIEGSFARAISINAALRCRMSDWTIYGSQAFEYVTSFDTCSRDSVREKMQIYDAPTTSFATEGCARITNRDCRSENGNGATNTNPAHMFQAAYNCWNVTCHGLGRTGTGGAGILFGFNSDTVGCRDSGVIGGSYNGNRIGVQITGSSSDILIHGAHILGNGDYGVWTLKQSSSLNPARLMLRDCVIRKNGSNAGGGPAVYVDGTVGNSMIGCRTEDNGNTTVGGAAYVINGGAIDIRDCDLQESAVSTGGGIVMTHTSTDVLNISDSRLKSAASALTYGIWSANGTVTVDNVSVTMVDGTALLVQGGTCRVRDLVTPVAISYGIQQSAGTIHLLDSGAGFAGSTVTAFNAVGGTRSITQGSNVAAVSTTGGTTTLTWLQGVDCREIETTGALTSDAVIVLPAFPGLIFVLRNNNTGAHNTGLKITTTINVAQGKSAMFRVNGSGDVERVTADT